MPSSLRDLRWLIEYPPAHRRRTCVVPGDSLLSISFNVKGIQAEAEVRALTPETVLLRIDPKTPWDAEALRCLSGILDMLAKTLPLKHPPQ